LPPAEPKLTVYYDGACPVCSREIGFYRARRGAEAVAWVDASACPEPDLGPGLDRAGALARFHVRRPDGTLVHGAAAFLELWRRIPAFAWAGRLLGRPATRAALERAYAAFLRFRSRKGPAR
jgi:predicted DCC family thiol-disulfide oxidoreductase YuxK